MDDFNDLFGAFPPASLKFPFLPPPAGDTSSCKAEFHDITNVSTIEAFARKRLTTEPDSLSQFSSKRKHPTAQPLNTTLQQYWFEVPTQTSSKEMHCDANKRQRRTVYSSTTTTSSSTPRAELIAPYLVPDLSGTPCWHFNGKEWPYNKFAQGRIHYVAEFTGPSRDLDLGLEGPYAAPKTDDVIIKWLRPDTKSKNKHTLNGLHKQDAEDLRAYDYYDTIGMPQPEVYLRPDQLDPKDLSQTNGGIWVMERIPTDVGSIVDTWQAVESMDDISSEGMKLLLWVKGWVEQYAEHAAETDTALLDSFRPENVMLREDGSPCLVDSSLPPKKGFASRLWWNMKNWSMGNEVVYNWLVDVPNFSRPDGSEFVLKDELAHLVAKDKANNGGEFPPSKRQKDGKAAPV